MKRSTVQALFEKQNEIFEETTKLARSISAEMSQLEIDGIKLKIYANQERANTITVILNLINQLEGVDE